ncbi:unnamed protein product [Cyprideis torosa]|uniref:Uncharacterized protein n=1 Tax=Cyprideis torosa TaxID=163714 RepID=A0A7R8ZKJ1_9CRUS|nr:unnamed protein product [Cyprideis torosa]CAG0884559.1 unnamed protein product [Cyprideis torosa]
MYLRDLPRLKRLWLEENPCADVEGYRYTVLRHLPNLEVLDNVPVEEEEIREAYHRGLDLLHPDDKFMAAQRGYAGPIQHIDSDGSSNASEGIRPSELYDTNTYSAGSRSPTRKASHISAVSEDSSTAHQLQRRVTPGVQEMMGGSPSHPSRRYSEIEPTYENNEEVVMRRHSQVSPTRYRTVNSPNCPLHRGESFTTVAPRTGSGYALTTAASAVEISSAMQAPRRVASVDTGPFDEKHVDLRRQAAVTYEQAYQVASQQIQDFQLMNLRGTYPSARNKSRTSNLLSAVLCILRELDVNSLEIVETAARCRIQELED